MGIVQIPLNPAAQQSDGAYVSESIQSQPLPQGFNSGTIAIPGGANWGAIGVVEDFSDYTTGIPFFGDTKVTLSSASVDYGLMARVAIAQAACQSFAGV